MAPLTGWPLKRPDYVLRGRFTRIPLTCVVHHLSVRTFPAESAHECENRTHRYLRR